MINNLGFLVSHNGSNMQAIIDACKSGDIKAKTVIIISNNSRSGVSFKAKQAGIPFYHLSSDTHSNPKELDATILDALIKYHVDLVILAGYDRKLGTKTLGYYRGKVINIHPSLLPKYGGPGMWGIRVHQAVLAAGEKETGVSIHLANKDYDRGPLIAQTRVPVLPDDTPETLAIRVLEREHSFFVETVGKIIDGEIRL